jgi:NAD(P)-dependent dehydrogenase (short-subunit alcohol dehydrogenase family)
MKTILITGAGMGLGKAIAGEYLAKGWKVIATDMDDANLKDLLGVTNVMCFRMDVTSDKDVSDVYNKLSEEGITLDLVVNNAGIDRYFPFSEAPADQFKKLFEVNLFGAYRVNQVLLPIVKKPGGRIILIGSESLNLTLPFMTYPLTKKALESYGRVLRQELKFHGIDVVVIRPGAIKTHLLENVYHIDYPVKDPGLRNAFAVFSKTASKEIGKVLDPREVAGFIYKVTNIENPKAVYKINNSLQLRIAALLPFSFLEKQIYKRLS